jgi:16S rRNA (guanine966-N2)-methyltransferase
MRVVAGSSRGRRLVAPAGADVRPTSDRVREAVFNALGSLAAVEDARVLDLFAGSGALAIEALSRGARSAVLVERDRAAAAVIERNLASTDLEARARLVRTEADPYLSSGPGPFDLVLLDPPYSYDGWEALLSGLESVVTPDAVVVIESDRDIEAPSGWRVERRKRYGSTFVAIVRPPEHRRSIQPPSGAPREPR